jgi:hypothetical protein
VAIITSGLPSHFSKNDQMQQKREMARSLHGILQVGKTPACNRWKKQNAQKY